MPDYGSLTLLFQDESGGLEVLNHETKEFMKAVPIPGTIVINVGDMFQRWTNDYLKSIVSSNPTRQLMMVFVQLAIPWPTFAIQISTAPSKLLPAVMGREL